MRQSQRGTDLRSLEAHKTYVFVASVLRSAAAGPCFIGQLAALENGAAASKTNKLLRPAEQIAAAVTPTMEGGI